MSSAASPHCAPAADFTCRTARSVGLTVGLAALVALETAVVHLLLMRVRPLAYSVSATSIAAIVWLVADYLEMGKIAVHLADSRIHLHVGRRARATIPLASVAKAFAPSWQDLGASAPRYLNITKPAAPNVLVVLREPQPVELLGGLRRPVQRIALHLDDPAAFLDAVGRSLLH